MKQFIRGLLNILAYILVTILAPIWVPLRIIYRFGGPERMDYAPPLPWEDEINVRKGK
jgi:hypothetical protein